MNKPDYKNRLSAFFSEWTPELSFSAFSVLPLKGEKLFVVNEALKKIYSRENPEWPEYLKKTAGMRMSPLAAFPWAKTIIIAAIPFRKIPPAKNLVPTAANDDTAGLIAGYAGRMDYHSFASGQIAKLAEALKVETGTDFKSEICVDTKPLAEKPLAAVSGLGQIGFNNCLLCGGMGSGICIASLVADLEMPPYEPQGFLLPCDSCGKCLHACPTGALNSEKGGFIYRKCRSYLTMEKRRILNREERKLLGKWIFGCDICTSLCPGSNLPDSIKTDLEWLLMENDLKVKGVIEKTAAGYAGVNLLRRNALVVLGNKSSERSKSLLAKFAEQTDDEMLKTTAGDILNEK